MTLITPHKHALTEKQGIQFLTDVTVGQKLAEFVPTNNATRFFNKKVLLNDAVEVTVHTKIENNIEKYYIYFGSTGSNQAYSATVQYYFKVSFKVREQNENINLNDIYNILAPNVNDYQKTYVIEGITFNNAPVLQSNTVDNLKLDNMGVFKSYQSSAQYVIDSFDGSGYFKIFKDNSTSVFRIDLLNGIYTVTRIAHNSQTDDKINITVRYNSSSKLFAVAINPNTYNFAGYVRNPNTNLIYNPTGYAEATFLSFEPETYLSSKNFATFTNKTYSVSSKLTNKFENFTQIVTGSNLKNLINEDYIFNSDFNYSTLVGLPSGVTGSFLLKNYILGNSNNGGRANVLQVLTTIVNGNLLKFERVVLVDGNTTDWTTNSSHQHQPSDILTNNDFKFVSQAQIDSWNAITSLSWKMPVSVFSQLSTNYPNPENGWISLVISENKLYVRRNNNWEPLIRQVSETNDGYLSSSQYIELLTTIENNSLTTIPTTNPTAVVHSKTEYDYLDYLNNNTWDIVKRDNSQFPVGSILGLNTINLSHINDNTKIYGLFGDYSIGFGTNIYNSVNSISSVLIGNDLRSEINPNVIGIGNSLNLSKTVIGLGKYNLGNHYFEVGAGLSDSNRKNLFSADIEGNIYAAGFIHENKQTDFDANLSNGFVFDLRKITENKLKFHDTLKHKLQFLGFEELEDNNDNIYFPVVGSVDIKTENILGLTDFVNNLISQNPGSGSGSGSGPTIVYWNDTLKNMGVGAEIYSYSVNNPTANILYNVGMGHKIYHSLTEGSYNVMMGWQTGYLLTRAEESVLIGKIVGVNKLKTVVNSVIIGTEAAGNNSAITQSVVIGAQANYGDVLHQSTIIGRVSNDAGTTSINNNVIIADGNNNRAIHFNFSSNTFKIARPTKFNGDIPALCIDSQGELFIGNVPGAGGSSVSLENLKWTDTVLLPSRAVKVSPTLSNHNLTIQEGSWNSTSPIINYLQFDGQLVDGLEVKVRNDSTSNISIPHISRASIPNNSFQIYNGNQNDIYLKPKQILTLKFSTARGYFESINYSDTYINNTETFSVKSYEISNTELRLNLAFKPILNEYINVFCRGLLISPVHYVINDSTITISLSSIEYPIETTDLITVQYKY